MRRTGLVGALLALGSALGPALALGVTAQAAPSPETVSGSDRWSQTKTLTRQFVQADGSTYSFPSYDVTVKADQTRNLRGRQRIEISWSGAQPSGGRASNPYGENGLNQEYPVVIMQCRGVDDPTLPKRQQLRPETCWTNSTAQRSQITRSEGEATWTVDADAAPEDRERISGMEPFPTAEQCPTADIEPYFTRLTPFEAVGGTIFPACDALNMPPEAAVGAAFPPAELAAFTGTDGRGSVSFEVRSDVENESLGCSYKVACSVVVIPIVGVSCAQPATPPSRADTACRRGGRFAPGSSNFGNEGVDQAVGPALWWSASNWKNRFSIPITFGLPPDTCDVLDPRPPTGFYGSELLAQAALQWAPAYCLDEDRFKFQLNQMSDEAGWNLMETGGGAAAVVSSEHDRRGPDPVGYAPTAVTGFGIGYTIDRVDNAGAFTDLRLTPRLIAKLLTQSYLGSDLGRGHPGIGDNPLSINADPEFIELNPGLSTTAQEAAATMLSLANSSDLIEQVTAYIAQDEEAMAFISGKADPWGMKVNPAYEDIDLPRAEWPLLDDYVPETANTCRQDNPAVYFTQLAAPVTTLRKIAEALLDAWPNVQTRCEMDLATGEYKLGRIDRQSYGSRFMLGLVSLGDAERYDLDTAALRTTRGTYVAPDDRSLAAAIALTEQQGTFLSFVLEQADVIRSDTAYPGTMVVYTAARLRNLPQAEADKVALFIRTSVTEGQRPGSRNGQLPAGYLPITDSGVTRPLFRSALQVADAVEAQREPAPAGAPETEAGPSGTSSGGGGVVASPPPGGEVPQAKRPPGDKLPETGDALAMPPTQAVSSPLGGSLIPVLLLIGLLSGTLAAGLRLRLPRGRPR